jgi:hypothetical protein
MKIREIPIDRLTNLSAGLEDVMEDFSSRVLPVHESNVIKWDYVKAEIWEDSGRVIFFPASTATEDRVDITANYILCGELIDIVNELVNSDLSDEDYDIKCESLINNIAKEVINFFSKQHVFKLRCFNQDGNEIKILQG